MEQTQNNAYKTLYLSDIDGTLMRNDQTFSDYTVETVNRLLDAGMLFSCCTGRTPAGLNALEQQLSRFHITLPFLVMDGTAMLEFPSCKVVDTCPMSQELTDYVLETCGKAGHWPMFYSVVGDFVVTEFKELQTAADVQLHGSRLERFPHLYHQVTEYSHRPALFISVQDTYEALAPLKEIFEREPGLKVVLYRNIYVEDAYFLEVCSVNAGKDHAVEWMKKRTGAGRVVVFGDNGNDLHMFHVADVACAVDNAIPEVREAAHILLASNMEDGVARFLAEDFGN